MSEAGVNKTFNYEWDDTLKKWIKQVSSSTGTTQVNIENVTPVNGRLPVDTELTISGDVIVDRVNIQSIPLTEVYPSGTYAQLLTSDDLVTTIQYHESDAIFGSNSTISGITYSSVTLGTTAYETFASGTNTLVITRGL
uniref:Uncharacterized protein n=1 Tax=viral metagenome TaxID=1070528 RepID=A0A6M3JBK3_9ZZZZ